ncbi:MAG TPA: hypothetical protein VGH48_05610 [Caldimonas sp.]|jgi:hypothetical protein
MGKSRFRSALDQALFVLLIMVGATASVVVDVRSVASAMAAGKLNLGATAVAAPAPLPPAAVASAAQRRHGDTLVARGAR